jgi:hypothetical protein
MSSSGAGVRRSWCATSAPPTTTSRALESVLAWNHEFPSRQAGGVILVVEQSLIRLALRDRRTAAAGLDHRGFLAAPGSPGAPDIQRRRRPSSAARARIRAMMANLLALPGHVAKRAIWPEAWRGFPGDRAEVERHGERSRAHRFVDVGCLVQRAGPRRRRERRAWLRTAGHGRCGTSALAAARQMPKPMACGVALGSVGWRLNSGRPPAAGIRGCAPSGAWMQASGRVAGGRRPLGLRRAGAKPSPPSEAGKGLTGQATEQQTAARRAAPMWRPTRIWWVSGWRARAVIGHRRRTEGLIAWRGSGWRARD